MDSIRACGGGGSRWPKSPPKKTRKPSAAARNSPFRQASVYRYARNQRNARTAKTMTTAIANPARMVAVNPRRP